MVSEEDSGGDSINQSSKQHAGPDAKYLLSSSYNA